MRDWAGKGRTGNDWASTETMAAGEALRSQDDGSQPAAGDQADPGVEVDPIRWTGFGQVLFGSRERGEVKARAYRRRFATRCGNDDIVLLTAVDEAHDTLSGPA